MANGTQNASLALHASRDLDDGFDQNLTDMLADDSIVASGGDKVGMLVDIDNGVGGAGHGKGKVVCGQGGGDDGTGIPVYEGLFEEDWDRGSADTKDFYPQADWTSPQDGSYHGEQWEVCPDTTSRAGP